MIVRAGELARDGAAILAIVNDAILNSTAWYEHEPWDAAALASWFAAKRDGGWPLLVAEEDGVTLGFASYGVFRARPAYARTVEHSVYVAAAARGRGVGRLLLDGIVAEARRAGYHTMIGGVDAANEGSLAFHRAAGFVEAGRMREVGRKFDRWLDLIFMQKMLED
ncbi:GNAT family N-acetyltransferase [Sphingoaurantiacus capsulatus]|uniref:GNAT family N-acetyltransferase n=1 Tax=Sphingoaurantiacus capsulatus TaxID=1771310 RepID=A0ABV7XE92_9SPHN